MESRRKFTRDFKIQVLRELENGKSVAELCRENQIHESLLCRWRQLYRKNPEEAFAGHGNTYKLEAKLAEQERIIGRLYAETELLKKTLTVLEADRARQRKQGLGG